MHLSPQPSPLRFASQSTAASLLLETRCTYPASGAFAKEINRTLLELPDPIQRKMRRRGVKVSIGRFLTEVFPDLKGKTPRGWDTGSVWDQANAVGGRQRVGVSEYLWWVPKMLATSKFKAANELKITVDRAELSNDPIPAPPGYRLMKSINSAYTCRHEIGHVMNFLSSNDFTYARSSDTPQFERHYLRDITAIPDSEREAWYYFLQPDESGPVSRAGRDEGFAEAAASLWGGGCIQQDLFKARFKHTIRFVQGLLTRTAR